MAKRVSSEETNIDYNKDNIPGNAPDQVAAAKDTNKDGEVSAKEEKAYNRASKKTVTKTKTNKDGSISTSTNKVMEDRATTKVALEFGNADFFAAHPDVKEAADLAAKENWTQEKFNRYVENETSFGQMRTDSQSSFDMNILGSKREDLEYQISQRITSISNQVSMSGINISDEEIATFAREAIRSGYSENDTLSFIASKWKGINTDSKTGMSTEAEVGTIGSISDQIRQTARNYGLRLTDSDIELKSREALKFGANWREYLSGQEDVFRRQAMNLYPTIREQLREDNLSTIMNPYLNEASELLGVRPGQIQLDDPMWLTALNGPNGPMSSDEWNRVLRTDKKYGFDGTTKARTEAANIADELRSAFAMA